MNEIARIEPAQAQRLSITEAMATHYGMMQDAFMATMRATVFAKGMSREEEAAFLLVAKHHNLNPVTREIYAMPKKGGGIIPVVSIDGWIRMANEHPAFDGVEFEDHHDGDNLISTTCRIYRKDRSRPIVVTEYLAECVRNTDAWLMKHRMLRHKSFIQCGRVAFGFAGIYDPDEAERFAAPLGADTLQHERRAPSPSTPMIEAQPVEPAPPADPTPTPAQPATAPRRAPSPSAAPAPQQPAAEPAQRPAAQQHFDPEATRKQFAEALKTCSTSDEINTAWERIVDPWDQHLMPPDREDFAGMCRIREGELGGGEGP